MKQVPSLAFLCLALALSLSATPTTITDILLQPNGSVAAGVDFTITQASFFSGSNYYPAWTLTPHPVTDSTGAFSFSLEPNPAGQLYTVTLTQPNGVKTSTCWNVPISGSAVNLKTVLSTACGTPVTSIVPLGQINPAPPWVDGFGYLNLPGATFRQTNAGNIASGDVDLYTAPAGKRAVCVFLFGEQNTGAPINVHGEIKIAGLYYRTQIVDNTITSGTQQAIINLIPIVLEPGDSYSVNTSAAGFNIFLKVIEFPASYPFYTPRLTSLAASSNTLYKVPAGKSAMIMPLSPSGSTASSPYAGNCGVGNFSGGTLTYSANIVPSGGAVSNSNLIQNNTSFSGQLFSFSCGSTLTSGDVVNITSSGAAAGQYAFVTVVETSAN